MFRGEDFPNEDEKKIGGTNFLEKFSRGLGFFLGLEESSQSRKDKGRKGEKKGGEKGRLNALRVVDG